MTDKLELHFTDGSVEEFEILHEPEIYQNHVRYQDDGEDVFVPREHLKFWRVDFDE